MIRRGTEKFFPLSFSAASSAVLSTVSLVRWRGYNLAMSEEFPKKSPEPVKEPIAGKTWPEIRERLKKELEDEYWRLRAEGQNRVLSKREKELMEEIKKNVGIEE